jgi:isopentenyldiphosphate isomerase
VGAGNIESALRKGLAARIARVFVANEAGMLLLQQRAPTSYSPVVKWGQSAGGHVDVGETYAQAAVRELAEEMGVVGVQLRWLAKFYTEELCGTVVRRRFNVLFGGIYNGPITIDRNEVADYRWVAQDELRAWVRRAPAEFTKSFALALGQFDLHNR